MANTPLPQAMSKIFLLKILSPCTTRWPSPTFWTRPSCGPSRCRSPSNSPARTRAGQPSSICTAAPATPRTPMSLWVSRWTLSGDCSWARCGSWAVHPATDRGLHILRGGPGPRGRRPGRPTRGAGAQVDGRGRVRDGEEHAALRGCAGGGGQVGGKPGTAAGAEIGHPAGPRVVGARAQRLPGPPRAGVPQSGSQIPASAASIGSRSGNQARACSASAGWISTRTELKRRGPRTRGRSYPGNGSVVAPRRRCRRRSGDRNRRPARPRRAGSPRRPAGRPRRRSRTTRTTAG